MEQLVWKEEVEYTFEYNGETYKDLIIVNGIDGKRYRAGDPTYGISPRPTSHKSTGNEFEELTAELVASRVQQENDYSKTVELLYLLPDTGEHLFITYRKDVEDRRGHFSFIIPAY